MKLKTLYQRSSASSQPKQRTKQLCVLKTKCIYHFLNLFVLLFSPHYSLLNVLLESLNEIHCKMKEWMNWNNNNNNANNNNKKMIEIILKLNDKLCLSKEDEENEEDKHIHSHTSKHQKIAETITLIEINKLVYPQCTQFYITYYIFIILIFNLILFYFVLIYSFALHFIYSSWEFIHFCLLYIDCGGSRIKWLHTV